LRILTDMEKGNDLFRDLISIANEAGLQMTSNTGKMYFQNEWRDPEFRSNGKPQIVVFVTK